MPGPATKSFTSDHALRDDGSVTFACSQNDALWPWSTLDSHHPGAIQALSYWVGVESAMALGRWDPDKWSALTWTRWRCGEPGVGRFATGTYRNTVIEGREGFSVELFDAAGAPICWLDGRGVIFRTRDFESWRKEAKDAGGAAPSSRFAYADRAQLALDEGEKPFLAPLVGGTASGLLDHANAMPPNHPWLDGSGDHVNSAHLAEIARQFVALLRGGKRFAVEAAEMQFDRYVELGAPFEISRVSGDEGETIRMILRQSGRDCTRIEYRIRPA
ncbi:hypothetical protein [Qipengyuania zhejiangensis]|uniref:hypothetical protein n=1 Tax=Qipengyuania zhejiangensis TaxID=3077782 RepID=UPI002D78365B|nr:hypothetical protein [Qipengyuania sp. Z2]